MASYFLAGTLKPDTAKAAAYYLGEESDDQAVQSWIDAQVQRGQQIQGQTVTELRPDLSSCCVNTVLYIHARRAFLDELNRLVAMGNQCKTPVL